MILRTVVRKQVGERLRVRANQLNLSQSAYLNRIVEHHLGMDDEVICWNRDDAISYLREAEDAKEYGSVTELLKDIHATPKNQTNSKV